MTRRLPIGIQDFRKIRESDYLYIDKSDMISQIMSEGADVYLYTRPRRFGKSLNLSMLDAFFNLKYPKDNGWFDGLKVSECKECQEHKNAYPVIHLDFKDLDSDTYELFLERLSKKMRSLYAQYRYLKGSDDVDDIYKIDFDSIISGTPNMSTLMDSLNILSKMLYVYHGKKVIILLDEYDNPIHNAYGKDFHQRIIDMMKGILSSVLKGNDSLMFGVITGVMQIAKESIFSGLNNLTVNNVLSTKYDEMFGFTNDEVKAICEEYGCPEKYPEAKEWYDGYRFGNTEVYNPWNILNYIDEGFVPNAYWAGTSGNSILDDLFESASPEIWEELRALAEGEQILYTVRPTMTFQDLHVNERNIYSLLVMSGYLTAQIKEDGRMFISIPNGEMAYVFGDMILNRIKIDSLAYVMSLARAFIAGNVSTIEQYLYDLFASSAGNAMLNDEHSYQAFITGMLMFLNGRYSVKADFEDGNGRYDIRLERKYGDFPNIVIEIKRAPTDASDDVSLSKAKDALKQVKERDYTHSLKGDTLLYGISFRNKRPTVVSERLFL